MTATSARVALLFLTVSLAVALLPRPIIAQDYILELAKFDASLKVVDTALSNVQHNVYDTQLPSGNAALEWEIILTQKPPTNTISFPIQTKDLRFHYQAPLTEELDVAQFDFVNATHAISRTENITRPLNVVSSYAVYHVTRRGNHYTTGKLWHIYRPFLIDAKLQTSWANLTIEHGDLTITADAKFLATAVYPVTIDPSFGKTDIGGSSNSWGGADMDYGSKFDSPAESGNIYALTAYCDDSPGGYRFKGVVYADNSGSPSSRLALGNENASIGGAAWYISAGMDYDFAASTTYWLVNYNDGLKYYYDSGGANVGVGTGRTYGTPPDPYGEVESWYSRLFSIFVNYTISGGQDLTFTRVGNINLWGSTSQNVELLYTRSSTLLLYASATMNKEAGFIPSAVVGLVASADMGRELLFTASQTLWLWASATPTFQTVGAAEYTFTLVGNVALAGSAAMRRALRFTLSNTLRMWAAAIPTIETAAFEITFILYETLGVVADVTLTVSEATVYATVGFVLAAMLVAAFIILCAVAIIMLRRP